MAERDLILLDGGMGRELQRRGLIMPKTIWSAAALIEHPAAVREIHGQFIEAGAEVITTNTYGVVPSLLAMEGMAERLSELIDIALDLAGAAVAESGRDVRIAGSLPPLDTSYRPDKVGALEAMIPQYQEIAERLAPRVDLLLCETMSTGTEARAAALAASETGKPIWIAWTLDDAANGRLRSGETVTEAYRAIADLPVAGFLFNCCTPEAVSRALPELRRLTEQCVGGYANAFRPVPADYVMGAEGEHPLRPDISPAIYLAHAEDWRAAGADVIGGCCGIGPDYIAALRQALT